MQLSCNYMTCIDFNCYLVTRQSSREFFVAPELQLNATRVLVQEFNGEG